MERPEPPCSEVELKRLEDRMGTLPDGFARFLRAHDGGRPESNRVQITKRLSSTITEFYGAASVLEEKEALEDRLPKPWWPIAGTESGNLFLLHAETGAIAFWDHETEKVHPAAKDFDALLSGLQPFSVDDVEMDPDQVLEAWIDPDFLKSLNEDEK